MTTKTRFDLDTQESFITQKVITVHQGLLLYMFSLLNEVTPSACRLHCKMIKLLRFDNLSITFSRQNDAGSTRVRKSRTRSHPTGQCLIDHYCVIK